MVGIAQHAGELSDADPPGDRRHGAHHAHRGIDQAVDKAGGRICDTAKEISTQRVSLQSFVNLVKLLLSRLFMRKCRHHFLIADHFLNKCGLLTARLRLQFKHGKRFLGDESRHQKRDRRQDDDRKRDLDID